MRAVLLILLFLATADPSRADSVPDWLKAAISSDVRLLSQDASWVVLLDEQTRRIRSNGDAEVSYRRVVRILKPEGRSAANKTVASDSDTTVSSLKAWHIRPDGKLIKLNKRSVSEESTDGLYSDIRRRLVRFDDVTVGSVVGFEWKMKEHPVANEDRHSFQNSSPVALSRYRLSLPGEWKMNAHLSNHTPVVPVVVGNTYTWELKDLPVIEQEPLMPDPSGIAAQIGVSYFPPRGKLLRNSFSTWQDVSSWAARLMDSAPPLNQAISARARELTAGLTADMERIRALARSVQDIRYVSIQLGSIGGYKPHPASVILKTGYGDCKDKACLLRALLTSAGFTSYNVLVHSGDPTMIKPDTPTVLPFNHAIVAVSVKETGPMVADAPRLGKLLFIDPTDELTPVGDLPFYLQGGYGLVVSKDDGALIRLPASSETDNASVNDIEIEFTADGLFKANVRETLKGQRGVQTRRAIASTQSYAAQMESRAASVFSGSRVSNLVVKGREDHSAPLEISYQILNPIQTRPEDRLLVIKPLAAFPRFFASLEPRPRNHPVILEMRSSQDDHVTLNIPPAYGIDELPTDVDKETAVGKFTIQYRIQGQKLVIERRIVIREAIVKAEDYAQLSALLDAAAASTSAGIILVKRNP